MGKLIDRLHELGRTAPTPMGFGTTAASPRAAVMLLVGEITAAAIKSRGLSKAEENVDALLVDGVVDEQKAKALGDTIWGVRLQEASEETLDTLRDRGCDFVLVETDQAPAVVLRDDGMARGFPITTELSEERARALDELPLDYLVLDYDAEQSGLSLARLMKLQTVVSMVGKHILLRASACPSRSELELLRDLPVDAIVLDVADAGARGLAEAKQLIAGLEPRKSRGHRDSPTIPQVSAAGVEEVSHEQEEDDWDDEP